MAQFWIAIFFILLAAAQLYQSIRDINLPFPVYLVLGTVLAVASNFQHKVSFSTSQQAPLPAIKTPEPVLTEKIDPALTATADLDPTVAQLDEIAQETTRTR
jgi:hypothetical protein